MFLMGLKSQNDPIWVLPSVRYNMSGITEAVADRTFFLVFADISEEEWKKAEENILSQYQNLLRPELFWWNNFMAFHKNLN